MSNVVIKAEAISKLYKLGQIGTGTLSHDINRWWASVKGKEDPFQQVSEFEVIASENKTHIALQNISFEICKGEVVGIIGKNGAGKSTLLKLLAKITTPTSGIIKIKGKIASLLEVGTGFHPELSGRENIFLNGAVLGMSKNEIHSKFDEIIEFAGIEKFIDTPVKRYSSGMYVRLAFAVAAFLEPEILIIDEVLAVGDAAFQRKCLGRMKDVSVNDGRTVLFVSHNMTAVKSLCSRAIYLKDGAIVFDGTVEKAIQQYEADITQDTNGTVVKNTGVLKFKGLSDSAVFSEKNIQDPLTIIANFYCEASLKDVCFDIGILNMNGIMVVHAKTEDVQSPFMLQANQNFQLVIEIPHADLSPGSYTAVLFVYKKGSPQNPLLWVSDISLGVIDNKNPKAAVSGNLLLNDLKSVTYPETFFSVHTIE